MSAATVQGQDLRFHLVRDAGRTDLEFFLLGLFNGERHRRVVLEGSLQNPTRGHGGLE